MPAPIPIPIRARYSRRFMVAPPAAPAPYLRSFDKAEAWPPETFFNSAGTDGSSESERQVVVGADVAGDVVATIGWRLLRGRERRCFEHRQGQGGGGCDADRAGKEGPPRSR